MVLKCAPYMACGNDVQTETPQTKSSVPKTDCPTMLVQTIRPSNRSTMSSSGSIFLDFFSNLFPTLCPWDISSNQSSSSSSPNSSSHHSSSSRSGISSPSII